MSTITFDTLKFADRLEKAGATRELAAAMAEAQREAFAEALDSTLAKRTDIERVERKLIEHDGRLNLLQWMIGFNLAFTMAVLWKVFS